MQDLIECAVIFAGVGMTFFSLGFGSAWLLGLFTTVVELD